MSGISSALELRTMYARRPRRPPEEVEAVPEAAAAKPAVGSVRSSESDLTLPGTEAVRCPPL